MTKKLLLSLIVFSISSYCFGDGRNANVVWNTPSANASESMPCGGGDIGMNVWVENDELMFYISRSGTYDEHNTLLKQGRVRVRLYPNPFKKDFRQELKMQDGYVEIAASDVVIQLWADVHKPVIHLDMCSKNRYEAEIIYDNWRYTDRLIRKNEGNQNSYKWAPTKELATSADSVRGEGNQVIFFHRNPETTVFDVVVKQQGMEGVKHRMMNPLKNLTSGGILYGDNIQLQGVEKGVYQGTDHRSWIFKTIQPSKKQQVKIALQTSQSDLNTWVSELTKTVNSIDDAADRKASRLWWNRFWERSFIKAEREATTLSRNYTLFRYMLGCNAYGTDPTKFNGGLFTFDPCFVDQNQSFTPDYRKWGGGTMTAQNQRLVYWPMLKSGDFDLMIPQFEFYNRMLENARLRSMVYWQHDGACFAEQIENFGLPNPSEYGWKRPPEFDRGVEYNAWLEYEWDTVLEFCQMILETKNYAGADIEKYIPFIESSLSFFNEHYRYLASRRGRKDLDGENKLILFPGSACETYKMTNNASSTVAALQVVLSNYYAIRGDRANLDFPFSVVPEIPLRVVNGKRMISPAKTWERVNNIETPQLYPVFPWRIYGIGRVGLDIARDTYLHDPDALRFRAHTGWKQDNIWAACLGLTDEAKKLSLAKLANGPHRFPAFWGPGFDWTPDHNWGGSGMIGLQEMLVQETEDQIILFGAWPRDWDVHFRLHLSGGHQVEARLRRGKADLIEYKGRKKVVVNYNTSVE